MKKVEIGSEVLIRFNNDEEKRYKIVTSLEADIFSQKVSAESLFGQAVLGRKEKERVTFKNPFGEEIWCQILEIK